MEMKKDLVIPIGLAIAIIGGALTGGIMIGDLQSKVASSSIQTAKQWGKIQELTIAQAKTEGKLEGLGEFKVDTKRVLELILKELKEIRK